MPETFLVKSPALTAVLLTLLFAGLHSFLMKWLRAARLGSQGQIGFIRPSELAYLLRPHNIKNTLLVMYFDLIHRYLKNKNSPESLLLTPYEKLLWSQIWPKIAATGSPPHSEEDGNQPAQKQKYTLRPLLESLMPSFTGHVRNAISKILQDPSQLRNYFSRPKLSDILSIILGSNYAATIEKELQEELLKNDLLVEKSRQNRFSKILLVLFMTDIICLAAILAFSYTKYVCLILFFIGLINAALLSFVPSISLFLPFFVEISEVVPKLKREGWRFRFLNTALQIIWALFYALMIIVLIVLVPLQILLLHNIFHIAFLSALTIICAVSFNVLILIQVIRSAVELSYAQYPTNKAQKLIKETRGQMAHISPITTFKDLLVAPSYDRTFSDLIAIYGIDTLWFLF